MECRICGSIVTEENQVCEDQDLRINAKADTYGMECLTENEQLYVLTGEVCEECI